MRGGSDVDGRRPFDAERMGRARNGARLPRGERPAAPKLGPVVAAGLEHARAAASGRRGAGARRGARPRAARRAVRRQRPARAHRLGPRTRVDPGREHGCRPERRRTDRIRGGGEGSGRRARQPRASGARQRRQPIRMRSSGRRLPAPMRRTRRGARSCWRSNGSSGWRWRPRVRAAAPVAAIASARPTPWPATRRRPPKRRSCAACSR